MCGITGWVDFERDLRGHPEELAGMTGTMACRGPDDEGTWAGRHAALGHRRLAVIDLAGGAQPMVERTPRGDVVLVFSGEVYNFRELRAELAGLGERFTTHSDTEVVLRAYLRWGERMVDRLNGMFAFAVWDDRDQRLVLVRDRLGVKPLYLYRTPGGVLFGSEPKVILAHPEVPRVVDADGLREWLAFVMTPRHAIWAGMQQVEPGTVVTVDRRGLRERTYWRLETRPHEDDLRTTVDTVRSLLTDTVDRQLVADVPRCVLLSGGLDSSTLVALAARCLDGEKVRTFSVDFAGHSETFQPDDLRGTADGPYVHAVAGHVGTEHTDLVLDHRSLADPALRRAVLCSRDAPVGFGEMDFSLHRLFRAIRERSTVALSGESADELFGGYRQYHEPSSRDADAFPWIAVNAGPLDAEGTGLTGDLLAAADVAAYRDAAYRDAVAGVARRDGEDDHEFRMRVVTHLHLTRFMRFLLERKDRLSMAAGLEVRVPFCDHRLMEYVYNAPWWMKNHDRREKSLLRSAVAGLLPDEVAWRPKASYPSIQDEHYERALREQGRELLARRDHPAFALVDRSWLTAATDPSAPRRKADRLGLERALDLEIWFDEYRPAVRLP